MRSSALAAELLQAVGQLRRQLIRHTGRPWVTTGGGGGLPTAQGELIRVVRRQPGISVAAAAAELGVAANTVSTLVGTLVEAGLLRREPDPGDRRVARLQLTDDAARQVARWRDQRSAVLTGALDRLPAPEREALAAALPALARLATDLREEQP
jgi:DNA-binding MarR family transcriptional regulator